jgi:hypothetical protein
MRNVLSIEELFSGRIFHVPDYQRGYAWEPRQVNDFIEDLELLSVHREHYTGTIVLHPQEAARRVDSEGQSYGIYHVVDGQQRLATIVLLLEGIRQEMVGTSADATLTQGIRRAYVSTTDITGLTLQKLTLNSDCDHYFRTVILSDEPGPEGPQISSELRLAEARDLFGVYLSKQRDQLGNAYTQWLTDLYLKVATRLMVTLYEVDSEAEVGMIFELMNNRGKPLSELEKVKNYLLYAGSTVPGPHGLAATVNEAWSEMLRQLMSAGLTSAANEDELLRAHWLTWYDPRPRIFDGSRSVKEHFDLRRYRGEGERLLVDLTAYAEGLRQAAVCVCDARAPERAEAFQSYPEPIRSRVKLSSAKLTRANVLAPFLPLLIAMRIRAANDGPGYLVIVDLCEKFAMRVYRFGGRRTDAGQKELIPLGYQLRRGDISFDEAFTGLLDAISTYAPWGAFKDQLEAEQDWYEWAGLKYFLYEYEEGLAKARGAVPRVGWEEVRRRERADTIEHVLPQQPIDKYWLDRFSPDDRRRYTHDLGNLTLTKDNSSYGRKPFPEKRGSPGLGTPCYSESPFFMERELAVLTDWTPDAVAARRGKLVQWALERWGLGELEFTRPAIVPAPMDVDEDDEEREQA